MASERQTREHIRHAFRAFDKSGRGRLGRDGVCLAMTAVLGYEPSRVDVAVVLGLPLDAPAGELQSATVSEDTFVSYMSDKMARMDVSARAADAFDALASASGLGYLTKENCQAALDALGVSTLLELVTADAPAVGAPFISLDDVFAEADLDDDGRITRADFLLLASRAAAQTM